jgi:hypothetical protein
MPRESLIVTMFVSLVRIVFSFQFMVKTNPVARRTSARTDQVPESHEFRTGRREATYEFLLLLVPAGNPDNSKNEEYHQSSF